ncbi:MAG: hypothetical protein U5K84_07315 [Alkalibacterium sp.]|nr:hypothetical protein [Alkalibacterium sp.]
MKSKRPSYHANRRRQAAGRGGKNWRIIRLSLEALSSSYAALQGEEYSGLDSVGKAMEKMAAVKNIDESSSKSRKPVDGVLSSSRGRSNIYSEMDGLNMTRNS